jgi:WD40 repeat protein
MIIRNVVLIMLIILLTACGQGTPSLITPPTSTIQTDVTPSFSLSLTPTLIPPVFTVTPVALLGLHALTVITSSNARDLEEIAVLTSSTNKIADLAFSGDGAYLASTGYEGKIRLWDVSTWQEVYTFPISGGDLNSIAFSPDGSLLASGQEIWNVATREIVHTLEEHLPGPSHVAFSPDGFQLAVVANRTIKVWDVASWNEVLSFDVPTESRWLFGISFSPDGKWLAACSGGNGTVYFWSAESGQLAFTLQQGNERDVHDIAFTPDGLWLATGGTDYFARLWDVTNAEELQKMSLIGMYSLAISPDGTLLATAGPDRTVKLWDVQNGKLLTALHHADELMAVAFSPDGRLIAAGGYDNSIVVWGISQ